jgi:hypothetical protein
MDAEELLQRESLRNLKRLSVVIEHLSPHVEEKGLTRDHLSQLVRHRLHEEGIEVLPKEEIYPGVPYLYVNVNVMNTNVGLNVFATQVVLKQRMILPREPFVEMHAPTWEIAGVGTVGTNNLTAIAESICKLIDRFSHEYQVVNPVKPRRQELVQLAPATDGRVGESKELASEDGVIH